MKLKAPDPSTQRVLYYTIVASIGCLVFAETLDITELRLVAFTAACACAFEMLAFRRELQSTKARWFVPIAAVVLIACLALKCGHELVGRLWVSTASLPGETWQQTFERHKEKAHALVEINVHR